MKPPPPAPKLACFCGREARGFFFRLPDTPTVHTCSMACLDIAHARNGNMALPTLTNDEFNSIMAASPEIGAFLEKLGKSDLATMTEEEWLDFLTHAYATICEFNRAKWQTVDGVPF
jgi:hypothetical protein